ncbi:probable LRR receptor-like serine/threonine-protein kinase At1g14390 isoform X1 [Elaeis guineensis]|uniref:non-specific serine/threonine protein kinase n=1 Tax=Elaeis guineensis var. tenera TaxID=51953 RepID=A0A6I9QTZ7_ELAGV|nr:probable LRR receptor-like serine/threonine-protein kinase At1g14390 [Elaeis guineensis]
MIHIHPHSPTAHHQQQHSVHQIKMASLSLPRSKPRFFHLSILVLCFFLTASAQQLSPSQSKTLLRLQRLLEFPPALAGLTNSTNFCVLPPSTSLSIACSGDRITQLSIVGGRSTPLSSSFSSDSLFTTLSRLPSLTVLSLVSIGIWGPLPGKVDRFASLKVLNLSSNFLHGAIPPQISTMSSLQNLVLAGNSFNGTVPDLKSLPILAELDLGGNRFGPDFPSLGESLVTLVLKNNSFGGKIPAGLAALDQLQKLDSASNQFVGWIPPFLFSLPSIRYLDLSGNQLTGQLPANLSCSSGLGYVDISNNLLMGGLPTCIRSNSSSLVVLNSGNCMASGDSSYQHSNSYCNDGALAAILPPADHKSRSKSKLGLIFGIVGGVVGGAVLLGLLVFLVSRRVRAATNPESSMFQKPIAGKTLVQVSPGRTPADARHMSQAARVGTLGLTPYRVFSMEELEEATDTFDPSNLIEDGPRGHFYKGWLQDGSMVVVRRLKLKPKHPLQSLLKYMDVISKLRHHHLVSILGHCIVGGQDGANTASFVFLVFEHVQNGTLRSHLTEWRKREMMKWLQRVSAVIGVARGIQFLHTVTVPGIVGNDLNIENILLDQTLTAKINNYNLPVLLKNKNKKVGSESPFSTMEDSDLGSIRNLDHGEKEDIYQLGLILLEIITGKPAESQSELDSLKVQLQKSLTDGPAELKGMADPSICGTFALGSLRTAVEITLNCISEDPSMRPSIDDVLWNLQYSVQVQDGWGSSENLSTQS